MLTKFTSTDSISTYMGNISVISTKNLHYLCDVDHKLNKLSIVCSKDVYRRVI